jgi:hypothetical protein
MRYYSGLLKELERYAPSHSLPSLGSPPKRLRNPSIPSLLTGAKQLDYESPKHVHLRVICARVGQSAQVLTQLDSLPRRSRSQLECEA